MATAQADARADLPSRKPRRSVIRSLSWKRASKRTKMDESEQERGFEASVDASIDGRSFNTTASSAHGMSDEDAEDTVFDSSTASSSKKRKKAGVWKAVKRFFSRKSGKGSRNPHGQPQRSASDPNLVQRFGERPDVAPLEQVDETPMETQSPLKKAISHGSLLSELRSKQRNDVDNEDGTFPITQQVPVVVQSKPSDIDWRVSPSSTPEKLLPGLNVSHDKIRVAPRHRRAPTRKGVASARHGGRDITDGNVIPRSRSVGARIQGNVLVEQSEVQPNVQELKALKQRENLKKRMEMADEQRQCQQEQEQEEAKRKQIEHENQKLEQEKLEQQKREQEKLEQEKLEQEKLEQEKLEQEKLEQERLEKQKLEEEKLQQEKLEKERLEQEKLEKQRLEQEKLEKQRLEQEKPERLEKEKFEQEKLEKLKLEQEKQEKLDQQKREQEKLKQERLDEENRQQQENDKLNQYNIQQTTDFSDLAESLRSSGNSKETYSVETTEVEMKETTSEQKPNTSRDISEIRGVALYQNIDTDNVKTEETHALLDIEINNTTDGRQTTNDLAVSPLLAAERVTASTNQEIRGTNEVTVVEQSEEFQPMSISEEDVHSENITSKHPETGKLPAFSEKISEDNTVVTVEKEESPPLSPPSSATPRSPVRSKRLIIETPEKVYQKPIMPEVRTEEAETMEKSDGPRGIQRNRPQSMHNRIRPVVEEKNRTQDDSNLGVAKLKQAFERSSRSRTISYDRRKPVVLPKPKPASKPKQSQTLEKNYRFPVTASKPHETETSVQKSPKKQNDDVVLVLDEVPNKAVEKKASVSSSLTKKAPAPKPKPLPKPQLKIKPNATTKTGDEGKENIKKTPNTPSVSNGSVKMSDSTDGHTGDGSKDGQSDLPSFWARRSIFSPEQKTNNSMPSQEQKTKEKHSPFIQLKTDTCAVCGSKVYQMEKFKVKDNIVHRSCIKCSVCKRLLSVGNFIMSQNKIYCKPHEPHVAISLPTV